MPPLIDLTGQKIGRWTVLEKAPNKNKTVYWLCQCDCGTIKEVRGQCLREGESISCGCYKREIDIKRRTGKSPGNFIDLTGQKFGKLTVLKRVVENDKDGHSQWLCQCDCGNTMIAKSNNLRKGVTWHCGCGQVLSKGEEKIRKLLSNQKIEFEQCKCFYDKCVFPDSNNPARFDFWVDNKYLIEYDGIQHFNEGIGEGWATLEKVQYTQEHDAFKNQWCKDNNITLIRIPYTHYDALCLEDLLPETSKFIIT